MVNVLAALWDGNIRPCEREIRADSQYYKVMHSITEEQKKFYGTFSPEAKDAYDNYVLLHGELSSISEQDAFIKGFRLGVQLLLSAVGPYESPLPQVNEA